MYYDYMPSRGLNYLLVHLLLLLLLLLLQRHSTYFKTAILEANSGGEVRVKLINSFEKVCTFGGPSGPKALREYQDEPPPSPE